jgi:hypothetical protein
MLFQGMLNLKLLKYLIIVIFPSILLGSPEQGTLKNCFSELELIMRSQDRLETNVKNLKRKFDQMNEVDEFKYAEAVNLAHVYYRQFVLLQEETLTINCRYSRLKNSTFLENRFHFESGELESRLLDDLTWFVWYRGIAKVNSIYFETAKLRRIIQEKAKVSNLEKFIVFKFQKKLIKKKNRRHLIKRFYHIQVLYGKFQRVIPEKSLLYDLFTSILKSDISQAMSSPRIDRFKKSYYSYLFKDRIYLLKKYVVDGFNSRFGNAAGSVVLRKGRLYLNQEARELVQDKMKPLDIIFEKTPFILTDRTIPGHFGHVAIYLGTKKQLIDNELWDQDFLAPYKRKIELGYTILEASREGVHLKKLVDFMNVDELLILRATSSLITFDQKLTAMSNSLDQFGRRYDFNFNVESVSEIVCSELIFFTFPGVPWRTEEILGRPTISPDDLVKIALDTNYLDFILYIKGNRKSVISLSERKLKNKLDLK